MFIFGTILLVVAALSLVGFLMQRHKSGRLGNTPLVSTADAQSKGDSVAGEKGAISVQGQLKVHGQPLVSPVTKTECVFYKTEVVATWKISDNQGGSAVISTQQEAAKVSVDDGSGPVDVVLSNINFDDTKKAFDKSNKMGLLNVMDGRNLKFGDKGFIVVAGGLAKDGSRVPSDAEYKVTETILPVMQTSYVVGKAEKGQIVAPNWVSLIVSGKSRDELLADTAKMMKRTKIVSLATGPIGAVLTIVALAMGNGPGAHKEAVKPRLEAAAPAPKAMLGETEVKAPAADVADAKERAAE